MIRIAILTLASVGVLIAMGAGARAGSSIRGDVNCSTRTDAIDATLILQFDAGLLSSIPCQHLGDVNSDGRTNAIDSTLILQSVAQLIPSFSAVIKIDVVGAQPIGVGKEFVAEIRVQDSARLSGYELRLAFDEDALTLRYFDGLGLIFNGSGRAAHYCDQRIEELVYYCVTFGPPVCLGGGQGPSGDLLLGRAVFRAEELGTATIALASSLLFWDDVSPCTADFRPLALPHGQEHADVTIAP